MNAKHTILVFAATNSKQSINKRLAEHAAATLQERLMTPAKINVIDLNDYEMPIYSPEREQVGIPSLAQDFYQQISQSDGVIISFAEYNGSYTTAFKNIFDWVSRINMQMYQNKPVLLMATSKGGRGGQAVLAAATDAFPHFGAKVTSSFHFGPFSAHFDVNESRLKTPELEVELRDAITAFQAALSINA